MSVIYKYNLTYPGNCNLVLPKGSYFLSVQEQKNAVCIWAVVDPKEYIMETRKLHIFQTGDPIIPYHDFIGTVQLFDGAYVLHVFEECSE